MQIVEHSISSSTYFPLLLAYVAEILPHHVNTLQTNAVRFEFEFYYFDGTEPNEFFHTCDAIVIRSESRASLHESIWLIFMWLQYLYCYLSLLTFVAPVSMRTARPNTTNALLFPDYGILRVDCVLDSFWLFSLGFSCVLNERWRPLWRIRC